MGTGVESTAAAADRLARARNAGRTALLLMLPFALAIAVLWLGGAVEILTYDDGEPGDDCWALDGSTGVPGRETDRWVGGGLLGRPGVVCESELEVETFSGSAVMVDRYFTPADALSAVLAAIAFIAASIVVFEELRPERRGPW